MVGQLVVRQQLVQPQLDGRVLVLNPSRTKATCGRAGPRPHVSFIENRCSDHQSLIRPHRHVTIGASAI
jgi:hypothetical protein